MGLDERSGSQIRRSIGLNSSLGTPEAFQGVEISESGVRIRHSNAF